MDLEIAREGGMGWALIATRQVVGEATLIHMAHQFECLVKSNVYMVNLVISRKQLLCKVGRSYLIASC